MEPNVIQILRSCLFIYQYDTKKSEQCWQEKTGSMCSLLAKVMFCLYLSHLTRLSIPLTYPTPLPPNVEQSAAPLFHSESKRRDGERDTA